MSDFLLELRCEEIPARMQAGARAELEKLFRRELDAAGVDRGRLTVWSTPRRLALIASRSAGSYAGGQRGSQGPAGRRARCGGGGFCRKNGITRESLELRDVKGRETRGSR